MPVHVPEKDMNFLSKLSQNDTLKRRRHEQQINNHLKQYQQASSDDEHEVPSKPNPSQPVVVSNFTFYIASLLSYIYNRLSFHLNNQ